VASPSLAGASRFRSVSRNASCGSVPFCLLHATTPVRRCRKNSSACPIMPSDAAPHPFPILRLSCTIPASTRIREPLASLGLAAATPSAGATDGASAAYLLGLDTDGGSWLMTARTTCHQPREELQSALSQSCLFEGKIGPRSPRRPLGLDDSPRQERLALTKG